jgi:hypothetical protein
VQLVEADVEAGFSLVDDAASQHCRGNLDFSKRALEQAEAILRDIEQRLVQLGLEESEPFLPLVDELRREISTAKSHGVGI